MATVHPTPSLTSAKIAEPTPADILRGAAVYLKHHGWTQHTYYGADPATGAVVDEFPTACPAGAIAMAICGRVTLAEDRTPAETRLYNRTLDFFGDALTLANPGYFANERCHYDCYHGGPHDPFGWNDQKTRTATEAIAALNAAADDWDRTHGGTQ